ncbi:MAG: hypothetical protein RIM72_18770 [Alphaproteobacteria bacterium]
MGRRPIGAVISISLAVILSLFALWAGFFIAAIFGEPSLFGRFGSIVILIGIFFAYVNVDRRANAFVYRLSHLALIRKLLAPDRLAWIENHFVITKSKIPNTIKKTEIGLICGGTIIWAFGDLFVAFLTPG